MEEKPERVYYGGRIWAMEEYEDTFFFSSYKAWVYEHKTEVDMLGPRGKTEGTITLKYDNLKKGERFNPTWLRLAAALVRKRAGIDPDPNDDSDYDIDIIEEIGLF